MDSRTKHDAEARKCRLERVFVGAEIPYFYGGLKWENPRFLRLHPSPKNRSEHQGEASVCQEKYARFIQIQYNLIDWIDMMTIDDL